MNASTTSPQQLCTFRLADLLIGIDVRDVQEVLRPQAVTPVPLAAAAVRGLINLRGQIVTALDMRSRFQLAPGDKNAGMNIVVRRVEGAVSLVVDAIGEVIDVDASRLEAPPSTLGVPTRDLVTGVYKLDDGLLLVLNTAVATEIDSGLPT